MVTVSLIALAVALVVAGLALCSSHIPWLRTLTGAAPHQPDEARDFAATRAAGYVETTDDWAARVEARLAALPPLPTDEAKDVAP